MDRTDVAKLSPELFGRTDGYMFVATLQLRTPLRVLLKHTEIWLNDSPPPVVGDLWHGIWVPLLPGQISLHGMMASDVGQIQSDGDNYLPFLIAVRRVAESTKPIDDRIADLQLVLAQHPTYVMRLGGHERIVNLFFPRVIHCIPGVSKRVGDLFLAAGLRTIGDLARASDSDLRRIKGCGVSTLANIREFIAVGASLPNVERTDATTL